MLNLEGSIVLYLVITILSIVAGMELYGVRMMEKDDARLIATSNYNYALTSSKLLINNWKAVSVNGDSISIITTTGEKLTKSKAELNESDRILLESLRDEIANNNIGFNHYSTAGSGNGNVMMSSSNNVGQSSEVSTSYSSSTSGFSKDLTVNMKDESNFSVAKSDLPFNWSRVFFNGDLITVVYKNGDVEMEPINSMDESRKTALINLKTETKKFQEAQVRQFSNTMQTSMDMVSNVFQNIMGTNLPRPPNYDTVVGDMFGRNFPFGPNNSPFSSAAGWPFSNGAFAFAGRR